MSRPFILFPTAFFPVHLYSFMGASPRKCLPCFWRKKTMIQGCHKLPILRFTNSHPRRQHSRTNLPSPWTPCCSHHTPDCFSKKEPFTDNQSTMVWEIKKPLTKIPIFTWVYHLQDWQHTGGKRRRRDGQTWTMQIQVCPKKFFFVHFSTGIITGNVPKETRVLADKLPLSTFGCLNGIEFFTRFGACGSCLNQMFIVIK